MFYIYYIPFVFMKIFFITYLMVLEYFLLKVNVREITLLQNGGFPIKKFHVQIARANTDYFIAQF